jgi:hypothetical protein
MTNLKYQKKNEKDSPMILAQKRDNDKQKNTITLDKIISMDKEETIIDMTNTDIFTFDQMTFMNFKTVKLINISLESIVSKNLTIVKNVMTFFTPKEKFENVDETKHNYYIIIFVIVLLIAFLNRESLIKFIKR